MRKGGEVKEVKKSGRAKENKSRWAVGRKTECVCEWGGEEEWNTTRIRENFYGSAGTLRFPTLIPPAAKSPHLRVLAARAGHRDDSNTLTLKTPQHPAAPDLHFTIAPRGACHFKKRSHCIKTQGKSTELCLVDTLSHHQLLEPHVHHDIEWGSKMFTVCLIWIKIIYIRSMWRFNYH